MSQQPRITVVCGHYGCGKTNLTLNLALEAAAAGERVTVADLDIVNPYFRSSEYGGLLEEQGVRLIAPVFAGTTLDTPTLPPELYSIFEPQAGRVFIDAGGDDAGVTALEASTASWRRQATRCSTSSTGTGAVPDAGGGRGAPTGDRGRQPPEGYRFGEQLPPGGGNPLGHLAGRPGLRPEDGPAHRPASAVLHRPGLRPARRGNAAGGV